MITTSASSAIEVVKEPEINGSIFSEEDYTGQTYFQSPMSRITPEIVEENEVTEFQQADGDDSSSLSGHGTKPIVKKIRLKIKKFKKEREYAKKQKLLEETATIETGEEDSTIEVLPYDKIEGKVARSDSQVVMDCKEMEYFPERNELEAWGGVEILFPKNQTNLRADKMIYNQTSNILKAYDNIVLVKDGQTIYGDFMSIDMNEESSFIDNPSSFPMQVEVRAKRGYMVGDKLIQEDGSIFNPHSRVIRLRSAMFGPNINNMMIPEDEFSYFGDLEDEEGRLCVKVNKILINAQKEHDTITLKKAQVYLNDKKIVTLPSVTFYTNKAQDYVEGNYPEFGSKPKFGMFAGPGFVFNTPGGSTLKVIPTLNYKNDFGFGGLGKFKSATNMTDFGYSSAAKLFIMSGKQKLDDDLYIQYGMNTYRDNWFLGRQISKYSADLIYRKSYWIKDFLAPNLPLMFSHRVSAGYIQDDEYNRKKDTDDSYDKSGYDKDGNRLVGYNIGTPRFRYMAHISQTLFNRRNEEELKAFALAFNLQGSAAVYGTGDTQFIGRVGPSIHTQYKYWMQDAGYYLSVFDDNTPIPLSDAYRYGRSNVYLRESFRLHKYLTLSWCGSVNLSNDAYDGRTFTESSFYASVGPDELKFNLGYDLVRSSTYFSVAMKMDTKNTKLEYDRMEIKNPDKLGKQKNEDDDDDIFNEAKPSSAGKPKLLERATVLDVEDVSVRMEAERI